MTQTRIQTPGPLLAPDGHLNAIGWSAHPLLDCNLERVRFYPLPLRPLQFLRVKRWDYYAFFTPRRFFDVEEELRPDQTLGSPDWGRGVWEYSSFWNWASASGFLPDGRRVGLNLGCGFGDLSAATENCLVLEGRW